MFYLAGKWFDLLIEDITQSPVTAAQHNNSIGYVSQYIPLWVGIADLGSTQAQTVTQSFFKSGLIQPGGVSTSTYNSTQQWDFPNCWAPLQASLLGAPYLPPAATAWNADLQFSVTVNGRGSGLESELGSNQPAPPCDLLSSHYQHASGVNEASSCNRSQQ